MRGFGNEVIIEEGALVRERQVIVRLPDPKRMQVKAKVNESKISLAREGQAATIRLDAFPGVELTGVVEKVNEYPAASSWWAANVKEYDTIVRIVDSPVMLRPGLNAEVNIRVDHQADVLQVPVQTVIEHGGTYYCAMRNGSKWEGREIKVGATNDKFVLIREGLEVGDLVAMNAAALREKLDLPEVSREPAGKTALAGVPSADPRPATPPEAKGAAKPDDRDAYSRSFGLADKNHDGTLDRSELPERHASTLQSVDANKDGKVDLSEWTAAERRFNGKSGAKVRAPAGPGGGP